MNNKPNALVVQTSITSLTEAKKLAHLLLESKACACVQAIPKITSLFHWNNNIQSETEVLMLIKTISSQFSNIKKIISKHHPYDVPEIIALPISNISDEYYSWINNTCK
jgi:Uncharacterized protein involved in tolerance to divalent cations